MLGGACRNGSERRFCRLAMWVRQLSSPREVEGTFFLVLNGTDTLVFVIRCTYIIIMH